jgi:hypothetical protein
MSSFTEELLGLMRAFDAECQAAARKAKRRLGKPKCRNRGRVVLESDQAGCMPEQVPEANENLRRMGRTDIRYRPDGIVEYGGLQARRDHHRMLGLRDSKDYYS